MKRIVQLLTVLTTVAALGLSAAAASTPQGPATDGTLPGLTAIAGQGMMQSEAYSDLEYLSDYIGPRLTGAPGAKQAVQWGAERMKAIGLENVHTE
ncbi:MAG: hypothetical protein ACRD18_00920, partial [Terriglobia bacterium]